MNGSQFSLQGRPKQFFVGLMKKMESKDETEAKDKEVLANGISGMPGRKLIEAVSFFASGSASGRGGGEGGDEKKKRAEK